jgi:hypothetical protein
MDLAACFTIILCKWTNNRDRGMQFGLFASISKYVYKNMKKVAIRTARIKLLFDILFKAFTSIPVGGGAFVAT